MSRDESFIQQCIVLIDRAINQQLNAILHHPAFQRLEASWRGVAYLLTALNRESTVHIKILSLSFAELRRDVLSALEFDQSQLFHKVYSHEFGRPGGEPFGLLIGDYYFQHLANRDSPDSTLLHGLGKIAASAFAPFIAGVDPALFGLNSFEALKPTLKLDSLFSHDAYQRWNTLRQDEDMRFVGLALPRFLLRRPYNAAGKAERHRFFVEAAQQHQDYLWGNACFAYAMVVMQAYTRTGWFSGVRGLDPEHLSGGALSGLIRQATDPLNTVGVASEVCLSDQQERFLSEQGFLALKDHPLSHMAVFYNAQSWQKKISPTLDREAVNAIMSTMLHYLLCAARFAHYVKIIMRDKVGSFSDVEQCEHHLQRWLLNYCAATPDMPEAHRIRYPLQEARVEVSERTGMPGKYNCVLYLKPHCQTDEIQSHLKLVTQITF